MNSILYSVHNQEQERKNKSRSVSSEFDVINRAFFEEGSVGNNTPNPALNDKDEPADAKTKASEITIGKRHHPITSADLNKTGLKNKMKSLRRSISRKHKKKMKNKDRSVFGGSSLFEAINQRQWNKVLSLIKNAPHEVETFIYSNGFEGLPQVQIKTLPLHQACMRKPPAVVVSSLIACYPIAASTKCDGSLPFHHALKTGATVEVIKTLIISYPKCLDEDDGEGNKPIEVFQKYKSAWNHDSQTLISRIIEGSAAEIDLNDTDSSSSSSESSNGRVEVNTEQFDVSTRNNAVIFELDEKDNVGEILLKDTESLSEQSNKYVEVITKEYEDSAQNDALMQETSKKDSVAEIEVNDNNSVSEVSNECVEAKTKAFEITIGNHAITSDLNKAGLKNKIKSLRRSLSRKHKKKIKKKDGSVFVSKREIDLNDYKRRSSIFEDEMDGLSIMSVESIPLISGIIEGGSAEIDLNDAESACSSCVGSIESENYIKMVLYEIEYGDMKMVAEAYDIMTDICGMQNHEISQVFADWNKGNLESYLIEKTAAILSENVTAKGHAIDCGTSKWTTQEAVEVSVAAPLISGSLNSQFISNMKVERVNASRILSGPTLLPPIDKKMLIDKIGEALYASKICSYAQGLDTIKDASEKYSWNIDLVACIKLWKGGCVVPSKLLNKIQTAFLFNPDLPNVMLDPSVALELRSSNDSLRAVVVTCAFYGIPCPLISGSLSYYDSYRAECLPTNLTQAQHSFFGGHTFQRNDRPGSHHCNWTDSHKDIGDTNVRR